MTILFTAIALFAIAFALQIVIWRIRLPKNQTLALLMLYCGVLAGYLIVHALGGFSQPPYVLSDMGCLYLALMYLSVLPSYAILYTMVEAESPSSLMALSIDAAGSKGVEKSDFSRIVTNDLFIWNRVATLEKNGHIEVQAGKYFITPQGFKYMQLWLIPRRLMGRQTYGG